MSLTAEAASDPLSTLGLDHLVVHGWSFGGLVAVLFADLQPTRVDRLVLIDPTLPGPLSTVERAVWQTLGRVALLVGPALRGGLVGVFGSALVDMKQRYSHQQIRSAKQFDIAGGDLSRCSPELTTLVTEQLDELRSQPHRLRSGMIAFASAVSAMYVDRRPAKDAIDRLTVPTLLLWGDQDPLIERTVVDYLTARRPDWDLHIFETVGHLPPWEVPDAYTEAFGQCAPDTRRQANRQPWRTPKPEYQLLGSLTDAFLERTRLPRGGRRTLTRLSAAAAQSARAGLS